MLRRLFSRFIRGAAGRAPTPSTSKASDQEVKVGEMLYGKPPAEPESLEPEPDPNKLTSEQQLYAWRLLELTSAVRKGTKQEGLTLADLNWLTRIARSRCDLHKVCDALRAGCSVTLAVDIFT